MRSNKELVKNITKIKELKRLKKQLEDEISACEEILKSEMKVRRKDTLSLSGWTLKIQEVTSKSFDSKRFKNDFAELYNNYVNDKISSRFYILKEGN